MTRSKQLAASSKQLVSSYYKLGMGISYLNVLLLRDVWTMHDIERCSVCFDEIAEGETSISIIDNDDFLNDTLTGGGIAHRCYWMFLQRLERLVQEYEANIQDEHARVKDAKTVSQVLTEKVSEMQAVTPYRTIQRGESPTYARYVLLKYRASGLFPYILQSTAQQISCEGHHGQADYHHRN